MSPFPLLLQTIVFLSASSMMEIPAGDFIRGESAQTSTGKYFIDAYEVTNAEFAARFPDHVYPPGAEPHPVTGITRKEAALYCGKVGKRLPTEAEWEKAARGTDARIYPWGDKAPRKNPHPFHSGIIKRRVGLNKTDVSPYGVHDMAGSVWEWTADTDSGKAVTKGGLWNLHLDYEYSRTFEKNMIHPDDTFIFLGFRCAKTE